MIMLNAGKQLHTQNLTQLWPNLVLVEQQLPIWFENSNFQFDFHWYGKAKTTVVF